MKKAISLILALVMCLSLCACGGPSREEMLATAQEVSVNDLSNAFYDNKARAEANYIGKPLKITGKVHSIEADHFIFRSTGGQYGVNVYLSKEELMGINKGDTITVIGIFKNYVVRADGTQTLGVFYQDSDMKNAFIVK